jgi:hypothetical protein
VNSAMQQAYLRSSPQSPAETLEVLRDLLEGPASRTRWPETLSARTGAPVWDVEAALKALKLDSGEIVA